MKGPGRVFPSDSAANIPINDLSHKPALCDHCVEIVRPRRMGRHSPKGWPEIAREREFLRYEKKPRLIGRG